MTEHAWGTASAALAAHLSNHASGARVAVDTLGLIPGVGAFAKDYRLYIAGHDLLDEQKVL